MNLNLNLKGLIITACLSLLFPNPAFAQKSLFVQSHLIEISQTIPEGEDIRLTVREQIKLENTSQETFRGLLNFRIGKTAKEVAVIAIRDKEKQKDKGPKVLLESKTTEEGLVAAKLPEEVFIEPKKTREVHLLYIVPPDENSGFLWQRKILYPHKENQTQIMLNPIETFGYKVTPGGFTISKDSENEGWFTSPNLSPKVGKIYSLTIRKEPKGALRNNQEQQQQNLEEKPLEIIAEQVEKLISENLLLVLLANNILILSVIGLGFWWTKRKIAKD